MSSRLFWLSLVVQAAAVAALSALLIALPLPDDFFEDAGFVTGPVAWIACSLLTGRLLSLPLAFALFAALAGGVAGTVVFLVANHWAGVAAGLLVFAASCAGYEPEGDTAAA